MPLANVLVAPPVTLKEPTVAAAADRFDVLAVVLKKFVVVALVPVALTKVKFCKVEEALTRRLVKLPVPPEVILLVRVSVPPEPVVKKRLVVEAVPAKKAPVEVELVVVELAAVKFWKVEDALTKILFAVSKAVRVSLPPLAVV